MKPTFKMLLAASVLTLGAAAIIGAGIASERGEGDHRAQFAMKRGGMMQGGMGHRVERMMERFDADGDGVLTQAEIDASHDAMLKTFDANKDGVLELSEFRELWLDHMRTRMVDHFQTLDEDGDGKVTDKELNAPMARMMDRHDANDDDRLSREEMTPKRHRKRHHDDDDD
jgi:Ca2+-binding EF-hand superfamily protein